MAHQCEFVPSKRILRIQMAMSFAVGEGGLGATNSGNEDIALEWRCKFCLRVVKIEDVPHYGIEDSYDREAAKKESPPEPAKKAETADEEQVPPGGALSREEQEKILREALAQ